MSRLAIIFLTVFIDLIGFGIVLPLLPFFAGELGASPAVIGLIVGIHPGMQLVFGPIWGRLSDRLGRRPILLLGLVGSALSYLIFALATNVWWLFLSRAMAGIAGANVPVAQAYIADSTDLGDRTRGMGLIGAAFGLGFIAGPAIGGVLVEFGYAVPGFFAAGLSLANAIAAFFYLPESLRHELRDRAVRRVTGLIGRVRLAIDLVRRASVRWLMAIYALMTFAFSVFTTTFPLWVGADLGYNARHTGYLLAYFGLLMAMVQGRMIGPLARRFPERRLLVFGTALLAPAYALLPLAHTLLLTGGLLVPLALGTGITWPTLTSLTSQHSPVDRQGATLGVMQSLSALARMLGAAWGGWLFGTFTPAAPYIGNSIVMALAAAVAVLFMIRAPARPGAAADVVA
ncbi:MAG: MFS transporter [Gemmatimonadetes bacterium]|uniref:MFS transporter n=1 Tax=Candidatus Kutchimonas denitrificans TaxID=3056748 RepID=A0AAE5CD15_9BACT|nr:MFS transporter [Gemmatimonadota bacterium]NIR74954.1 MFS transporter [Candidatus Kutchimonas denitrificans]NIS00066.1 MFS transporter [Gemmatimonadota bacterium]NIT65649.1 MFS transporter [Gemmatimonadota bacterium]NIU52619.1 MFS transporter [Gemmatimonadota bacterium]